MKFSFMQFNFLRPLAIVYMLFLYSCKNENKQSETVFSGLRNDTTIRYAKRFAIASNARVTVVYLFGNRQNFDTTSTFLIYKDSVIHSKKTAKHVFELQLPCKNIAALSSIYASMLCDLNYIEGLTAIDNIDYINNPAIINKFNAGKLMQLSKGPQPDLEQTIKLNPDVVFTFGMGEPDTDINPKLALAKIPVAVSVDHLEKTPLARAEWIKFFAAFTGKGKMADSIFAAVEKNYTALRSLTEHAATKPTVFNEIKYGDVWYMPGGKSYVAQLLNDAGANYVWKNDTSAGSLQLSFEQVYAKAKEADYWINLSLVNNKKELLSYESRYAEFKAFKKGNLYNNNKVTNSKGYSTYWETGMIYPDRILSDMILIFHPELAPQLKNDLYYYKQIE